VFCQNLGNILPGILLLGLLYRTVMVNSKFRAPSRSVEQLRIRTLTSKLFNAFFPKDPSLSPFLDYFALRKSDSIGVQASKSVNTEISTSGQLSSAEI
jgi:hypothetical protein